MVGQYNVIFKVNIKSIKNQGYFIEMTDGCRLIIRKSQLCKAAAAEQHKNKVKINEELRLVNKVV